LTTTKPPERRESVFPWHSEKESHVQITPPFLKWYQSWNNITSSTKNWSPWQKLPNSEIEQRTQMDIPEQVPEQISEKVLEQQHNFESDKVKQQENLKFSFEYEDLTESDKNFGYFKDESKYGNYNRPQNEIGFNYKPLKNDENKKMHVEFENGDLYEGVATDSTVIFFLRLNRIFFIHCNILCLYTQDYTR